MISKGEKTIFSRNYGSANLDYHIPISSLSAFDIASVSKQFTAACIALLIIEGKLDLDKPVGVFVPELWKYRDTIRIKHLIYNTSGINDYFNLPPPGGRSWVSFYYFTIDDCIAASLKSDTLLFRPGTRWNYCNTNYMLLTKVVERVSGISFRDFARQRLFQPLGMTHTLINDDNTEVILNRVTPYNPRTTLYLDAYKKEGIQVDSGYGWMQHVRNAPHYGGSGVVTTTSDLARWSNNFFTQRFGGKKFVELMLLKLKFENGRNNQAFGLYEDHYRQRTYWAWDGGDYGISAQMIRFPDKKWTIIVLSNRGDGRAAEKALEIADQLIEKKLL